MKFSTTATLEGGESGEFTLAIRMLILSATVAGIHDLIEMNILLPLLLRHLRQTSVVFIRIIRGL